VEIMTGTWDRGARGSCMTLHRHLDVIQSSVPDGRIGVAAHFLKGDYSIDSCHGRRSVGSGDQASMSGRAFLNGW